MRSLARRVPRAAWLCALVALVNGVAWSLLVPPYQVPDENAHVAYVQYIAEAGNLPVRVAGEPYSVEQQEVLTYLHLYDVIGRVNNRPPITAKETRLLREAEAQDLSPVGPDANNATENPPLYYALAAVPYLVTPSSHLLDRVVVIRLLSAVLFALTTIAVFLFVRETLPSAPWVWPLAGLLTALEPMAGFLAGGVTPDALLIAVSALALLGAARCLRRGPTVANTTLLVLATIACALTKPVGVGFVPGAAVALLGALVLHRDRLRGLATGLAVGGAALGLYVAVTHTVLERTAEAAGLPPGEHALPERLSYIWQLYLPRLPFQLDLIEGFPLRDVWLPGVLGRFGWLDYTYPGWVQDVFFWTSMAILAVALAALVRHHAQVWRRAVELVTYLAFAGAVLVGIGWQDFNSRRDDVPLFEQGRYLLPLLALFVGIVAVALRGLGPRVGRPVGALLVMAMLAASIFGQLMTIDRFYS